MNKTLPCIAIIAGLLLPTSTARADLPSLDKQPWMGFFLGIKERKFKFGVSSKGKGIFEPLKSNGQAVSAVNPIRVNFDIIETTPDGNTVRKEFKDGSLVSDQEAVVDPKGPVTIRGMVTGDAAFEVTITPERSGVSITGKITDKGTLTNPLHFAVSADFTPYKKGQGETPAEIESFQKKVKRDEIRVESVTRKRADIEFLAELNPATIAPEGLAKAEIRTEGYGGVGFELSATDKSKFNFEDKGEKPLWNGFTMNWTVNEGADPATQKFTISAK